jgi:hypothetical protein
LAADAAGIGSTSGVREHGSRSTSQAGEGETMTGTHRSSFGPRVDPDLLRARTLHLAEGILIALQRRPAEQVIPEMVEVARDSGLSPFAIAETLVAVTSRGWPKDGEEPAIVAVRRRWGRLLGADDERPGGT